MVDFRNSLTMALAMFVVSAIAGVAAGIFMSVAVMLFRLLT